MRATKYFIYLTILSLLVACAKIYYAPDAYSLAQNHKIIAIAPSAVSIAANKKVNAESLKEQQKTESLNFQKEIYSWLLKRKMQGKFSVEILDVETTNAKLSKAGYPSTAISPAEMCQILNVDGLITSSFALSKPMSDGGAVAVMVLTGYSGNTNEVRANLSIHDGKVNKLLWNYEHKYSGGLGSSPAHLVDGMMRASSKKMPYMRK
jgi:hypothetical protein